MSWWEDAVLDRDRVAPLVTPALESVRLAQARGLFPQALLLAGPPGLGREVVAVETAASLVCDRRLGEDACARRVRRGLHPDVVAVRPQPPSEQIKIDQVREVADSVAARPFEGRTRVWIFDGVEAGRFGAEAANAFLKTLEEPPQHARFLLLAANPAAVLATIRSRCQLLPLPGLVAAAGLAGTSGPPELAATSRGAETRLAQVRDALAASLSDREVRWLVRVPHLAEGASSLFETVAAVALEMTVDRRWQRYAPDLVRLAGDLLVVERRACALNLNFERQLLSCLLAWYRELEPDSTGVGGPSD